MENLHPCVIPVETGIPQHNGLWDPRVREDDGHWGFIDSL